MLFQKKLEEAPLYYWEEFSYMMAIPECEEENILKERLENFSSTSEFQVSEVHYDTKGYFEATVTYEKEKYIVGFYLGGVSVPEYYLQNNFLFKEKEKEALLQAKKAITIFLKFNENPKKCFHLQLKLACAFVPDLIGVLDESAEKMLPAGWVKMAAKSNVLPSAKDLFTVQAVTGKRSVWLHTHGLLRCGVTELEILESEKEHYNEHYNLLNTYAMYLIENGPSFNPEENIAYIGRLSNGSPIVAVCRSWTKGILEYKKLELGGLKDRENGHNSKTSIVFLYTCEEDEKRKKLNKVSIYNDIWKDNPLFFFSDEETNRMKSLAKERFSYVVENFKKEEVPVLIKIGLPLKQKGKFEYIWFELLEIKGDKFRAKLTQEPYDVDDIHTGDERWFSKSDVADWIIYTKEFSVTPSNAYLLEKE